MENYPKISIEDLLKTEIFNQTIELTGIARGVLFSDLNLKIGNYELPHKDVEFHLESEGVYISAYGKNGPSLALSLLLISERKDLSLTFLGEYYRRERKLRVHEIQFGEIKYQFKKFQ